MKAVPYIKPKLSKLLVVVVFEVFSKNFFEVVLDLSELPNGRNLKNSPKNGIFKNYQLAAPST